MTLLPHTQRGLYCHSSLPDDLGIQYQSYRSKESIVACNEVSKAHFTLLCIKIFPVTLLSLLSLHYTSLQLFPFSFLSFPVTAHHSTSWVRPHWICSLWRAAGVVQSLERTVGHCFLQVRHSFAAMEIYCTRVLLRCDMIWYDVQCYVILWCAAPRRFDLEYAKLKTSSIAQHVTESTSSDLPASILVVTTILFHSSLLLQPFIIPSASSSTFCTH